MRYECRLQYNQPTQLLGYPDLMHNQPANQPADGSTTFDQLYLSIHSCVYGIAVLSRVFLVRFSVQPAIECAAFPVMFLRLPSTMRWVKMATDGNDAAVVCYIEIVQHHVIRMCCSSLSPSKYLPSPRIFVCYVVDYIIWRGYTSPFTPPSLMYSLSS